MASAKSSETKRPADDEPVHRDGTRETVESIVIAFIFAFLFRTFEAEAFVIPTGSMAPTLMGRHKDQTCSSCGFEFAVGASQELHQKSGLLRGPQYRVVEATCPNCRKTLEIRNDPVFVGDRILVTKFNYKVADPNRWDVTVFKYPEDPSTNYIKRLCGLPGETIEVRQGDLYRVEQGSAEILRKQDLDKQIAVLQDVYHDDYPPRELLEAGWPERWMAAAHDDGPGAVAGWSRDADGWQADRQARTYALSPSEQTRWLRYRHFVPTPNDWDNLGKGELSPRARLILDNVAYDTSESAQSDFFDRGVYWVGDLSLSATLDLQEVAPDSQIVLELVEGARRYRCTLLPAENKARLSYVDGMSRQPQSAAPRVISEATVDISDPGEYEIRFANIDNRLWLAIDGQAVPFPKADYPPAMGLLFQSATRGDLTPAGIAASGIGMTVSHMNLERDIYYRAEFADPIMSRVSPEETNLLLEVGTKENRKSLCVLADEPEEYAHLYRNNVPWLDEQQRRIRWLPLDEDEFLLLGDNSPRSSDGRLWPNARRALHRHAVPRDALVGKALLIFWPHGQRIGNVQDGQAHGWTIPFLGGFFYHHRLDFGPNGQQRVELVEDYPRYGVPFYPNFERILRRIR